ncbi:reverse transcriptase [Cucumis melo var. makuwa]|uniref:Reverse transcriptase n=1 Tax=Cucumis melo var. makuwa TaxID=1194695 RepID=A0A5A7V185_CUCMM|nr:reverse transcriptase [Cucumis melo var. makuwa]TYK02302.1 reverse transcriptase [Cucumis melo var. makuwa]
MPSRVLPLQTPLECFKESYPSTRLIPEVPLRMFECTPMFITMALTRPNSPLELSPTNKPSSLDNLLYEESRKEVGSTIAQSTPIQDSEPSRDQGMTESNNTYVYNKMVENDRSNIASPEDMGEKGSVDEVGAEIEVDETKQDHSGNLDEYDPSLNILITLRKGTRSYTKHSIYNYMSYKNLVPQFKAFTTSLDSTTIPKNIHFALECPEWKAAVMEEMRALEKNKTFLTGIKQWDVMGV